MQLLVKHAVVERLCTGSEIPPPQALYLGGSSFKRSLQSFSVLTQINLIE